MLLIISSGTSLVYACTIGSTWAPFMLDAMQRNGVLSFFARGTNTIFFLMLHALLVGLFGLSLLLGTPRRLYARKRGWMVIVFWLALAGLILFDRAVATMTDDAAGVVSRRIAHL
jgi:hypothetical protein